MMKTPKLSLTRSAGTKLSPDQYAAIKSQADKQGLQLSDYIRRTLLSASVQTNPLSCLESLLQVQLEETQALRIIMLNLAALQANGVPLTSGLLEQVRERADALKAERAEALLLATANDQSQLATYSKNEEAA